MLRSTHAHPTMPRCRRRLRRSGVGRLGAAVAGALGALVLCAPGGAFAQEYPPTAGTLAVSDTSVAPGDPVTVSGDGYAAGTDITITFESEPVVIGNVRADAAGAFTTQVRIPADASPGNHTIKATGLGADGGPRVTSAAIFVEGGSAGPGGGRSAESPPATATRSGRLAFTGLESLLLSAVGVGLVVAGFGLATMARRRRTTGRSAA
jgi:hypothetical protein